MQISDLVPEKPHNIPAEYTIYAYDKYRENMIGHNKWQCISTGQDPSKVLEQAEQLFDSEQFQKIEVKKKFFDKKKKRHFVSTFHVLDHRPQKDFLLLVGLTVIIFSFVSLLFLEIA